MSSYQLFVFFSKLSYYLYARAQVINDAVRSLSFFLIFIVNSLCSPCLICLFLFRLNDPNRFNAGVIRVPNCYVDLLEMIGTFWSI